MTKKRRTTAKFSTMQLILAAAVALGVLILGGVWIASRLNPGSGTGLHNSDMAFSVPDHVGQPAPAFTEVNVDGHPYTLTPGDGRAKAIVFYMGYG